MLGELVAYAKRKQLVIEPGFAPKEIKWLATVSPDGRFTGVLPVGEGKKGQTFACCPDLQHPEMLALPQKIGVKRAAYFLWDTCGTVALIDSSDPEEQKKNFEKHPAFKRMLEIASLSVSELYPILRALSDNEQVAFLRSELEQQKAKPLDKISFMLGNEPLLNSLIWQEWWRTFWRDTFGTESDTKKISQSAMLDISNGLQAIPASTHPKITKIGKDNRPLVTYDKDAFLSFGLEKGQNGSISDDSASAYRAAVDHLLQDAPTLGQMKIAFWYDRELPPECDSFSSLFTPNLENDETSALERIHKLQMALKKGGAFEDLGRSRYFALALSGAAGRVMVCDWQTGSLIDFVNAITRWFEDLSIVNVRGSRNTKPAGLDELLMNVRRAYDSKKDKSIEVYLKPIKNLRIPFWRAALNPKVPVPYAALAKIMESHRSEAIKGDFDESLKSAEKDKARSSLPRIYARMGLLKAYHNRKGVYRMTPALDTNHPSPAYHCGRLLCLFARIQEKALGDEINAGVVQRYYGAASSTPALVLGRLNRLSQHHLSKISGDAPRLASWFNMRLAEVWNALGQDLPTSLTLEEQSLFALGYYQQFAFNHTKHGDKSDALQSDTEN